MAPPQGESVVDEARMDTGLRNLVDKDQSFIGAADPFRPRQGKTLTWKNVNMTVVRSPIIKFMSI